VPDPAATTDPPTAAETPSTDSGLQTLSGVSGQSAAEYTCAAAH